MLKKIKSVDVFTIVFALALGAIVYFVHANGYGYAQRRSVWELEKRVDALEKRK